MHLLSSTEETETEDNSVESPLFFNISSIAAAVAFVNAAFSSLVGFSPVMNDVASMPSVRILTVRIITITLDKTGAATLSAGLALDGIPAERFNGANVLFFFMGLILGRNVGRTVGVRVFRGELLGATLGALPSVGESVGFAVEGFLVGAVKITSGLGLPLTDGEEVIDFIGFLVTVTVIGYREDGEGRILTGCAVRGSSDGEELPIVGLPFVGEDSGGGGAGIGVP